MYKTSAGIQLIKTSEYNKLAKFIDEPTLTGEKVVNLSQKDAPSAASVDVKSVQLANDQVLNIDKTEETNVLPTFGGVDLLSQIVPQQMESKRKQKQFGSPKQEPIVKN